MKLMPQSFAEPNNTFQVLNGLVFSILKLIFGFFFCLGLRKDFFLKIQCIKYSKVRLAIRALNNFFELDFFFVLSNCKHTNNLHFLSIFLIFFIFWVYFEDKCFCAQPVI